MAHLCGQNLVAAESFTTVGSAYDFYPQRLKPIADRMLIDGLNRFVIHTSVHQPLETLRPGVGLGPFGPWFTRKETWAEEAAPWLKYLSRSSDLLQQGRFAADVLWFYGEDDNITALYARGLPPVPPGYAFDFVNADALTHLVAILDGQLGTPAGMRHRVLALAPEAHRMSLPVLRKIRDLVEGGAVLVGRKVETDVSLADDVKEFATIADRLWSGTRVGQGRVIVTDLAAALAELQLAPDFGWHGEGRAPPFVHRVVPNADVYFISNPTEQEMVGEASFKVTGKRCEIWRAESGEISQSTYRMQGPRTFIPLKLAAHDAEFIVMREPTTQTSWQSPPSEVHAIATLEGPWQLTFPEGRGAPPVTNLQALAPWDANTDPAIRYFSGTATYRRTFTIDQRTMHEAGRTLLDLGEVKNLAEVVVNGHSAGIVWSAPFRVDVSKSAHPGINQLEVRVTNLWPNRLIGDLQPGNVTRTASAVYDPLTADSPLLPSGLLGPVQLLRASVP